MIHIIKLYDCGNEPTSFYGEMDLGTPIENESKMRFGHPSMLLLINLDKNYVKYVISRDLLYDIVNYDADNTLSNVAIKNMVYHDFFKQKS